MNESPKSLLFREGVTNSSQTPHLVEEEAPFKICTNRERTKIQGPKPVTTVLASASINLLDWTAKPGVTVLAKASSDLTDRLRM
jgi:hypothetical protein